MKNICVTGGAGYIGSVLLPRLLDRGCRVTVFDSLLYGNAGLTPHIGKPELSFIRADIRDRDALASAFEGQDAVIHLAALVGLPACNREPWEAESTNVTGTRNVVELLAPDQLLIHASTVSNYGVCEKDVCDENTPLNPVSFYGRTKSDAEALVFDHPRSVCLRFATAFGVSPRMRFDLLINDFVYQAYFDKVLILFEKNYVRTFIHVSDIVRSLLFSLDHAEAMTGGIFNVGDDGNNFSKEEIALKIKKKLDYYLHFAEIGEDEDKRNYRVSYARINALGFKAAVSIDSGIDELIKASPLFQTSHPFKNF